MPDVYVKVTSIAVAGNTTKVPAKYAEKAKTLMKDAAAAAITNTPGVTSDSSAPKGYSIDITLDEIVIGTGTVKAVVKGVINGLPGPLLSRLATGNATVAGTPSDGAVYDAIAGAARALMVDRALPAIKQLANAP